MILQGWSCSVSLTLWALASHFVGSPNAPFPQEGSGMAPSTSVQSACRGQLPCAQGPGPIFMGQAQSLLV